MNKQPVTKTAEETDSSSDVEKYKAMIQRQSDVVIRSYEVLGLSEAYADGLSRRKYEESSLGLVSPHKTVSNNKRHSWGKPEKGSVNDRPGDWLSSPTKKKTYSYKIKCVHTPKQPE